MTLTELLILVAVFVVGVGLGASGYRYMLKRDPEKLESWATEIRYAKESARRRFE